MATYNFLFITGALIALYAASWLLARQGKYLPIALHRKIWNGVLLVSFVGMMVFSLLNVFAYDYGINALPAAINVSFWHVEFGIVCVLVALFHALWHIPYFAQYLPKANEKPKTSVSQSVSPVASVTLQPEKKE